VSSDGLTVVQLVVGYSSVEDARSDFDLERDRADHVIESSAEPLRLVAKFGSSFKVITLEENQISYTQSPHLEAALAFEKSWLKMPPGW
jgi:hypothetical protein